MQLLSPFDSSDLQLPQHADLQDLALVVLGAGKLGNTRLIDNLEA